MTGRANGSDYIGQQHSSPGNPDPYASGGLDLSTYTFTPEERRVFSECESDSFKYRSLPLMIFSGAAVHLAVQNGKLKPHPALGSMPKAVLAVCFSYVVGRVSYLSECAERIMRLPNSPIAEQIKKQRGLITSDTPRGIPGRLDHFQRTDRPMRQDYSRESEATHQSTPEDSSQPPFSDYNAPARARHPDQAGKRSFEELRNENRLQYAHSMYSKKTEPPNSQPTSPNNAFKPDFGFSQGSSEEDLYPQPAPADPEPSGYRTPRPAASGKKNAYGDNWDE